MSRVNAQLEPGQLIFGGLGFGGFDENGHPNGNGYALSALGSDRQRRTEVKTYG
jgi:hypothetical protein